MPKSVGEGKGFTISASELEAEAITGDAAIEGQGQLPCSLNGMFAAMSGAGLGAVFGFGGSVLNRVTGGGSKAKAGGFWKTSAAEAASSAKAFAVMSGVFALVTCVVERVRLKKDALNGAISGCATGLALGWQGGPASALQNCLLIGGLSYAVERYGGAEAQAAGNSTSSSATARTEQPQLPPGFNQSALPPLPEIAHAVLAPAAQFLHPFKCSNGDNDPFCFVRTRHNKRNSAYGRPKTSSHNNQIGWR